MTATMVDHWPAYKKRWEFNGTAEEAVIFSGANGGYESRMQYEFMLSQGLHPDHYFLDLGSGALRGTIRLVDYLGDGHFYGADVSVGLLKEAMLECERRQYRKIPLLQLMESFDIGKLFDVKFDFVLANSLTVHIEPEDIQELCFGIANVLAPAGNAFLSVHPLEESAAEPYRWDGYRWWYKRSWLALEAAKGCLNLTDLPGHLMNRIPGQKKPVIPVVNTNMTEWMMKGTL